MPKEPEFRSFPLRLTDEVEKMFDEMIHRPWGFSRALGAWNPSVDLYETPEAFILEADLPGVKGEDVRVEVHDGDLVLHGKRFLEQSRRDGKFLTTERRSGEFMRRITLAVSVDREAIQAEFKDGVLRVILPKIGKRGAEK